MNLPAVAIAAAFAGGFARRAEIRFPACRFAPIRQPRSDDAQAPDNHEQE